MTYDGLRSAFSNPEAEHRSMPFWAWNDALEPKELVGQIRGMYEQGIGGFFMHSREGLETEYLSEQWFDCVNACVEAAKELGMEAWLYDEDRWPSGTAGGRLTSDYGDESRCKGLTMEVADALPADMSDVLEVYTAAVNGMEMVGYRRGAHSGGGVFLILRVEVSSKCEWFNDEAPPDNLNPASVANFIKLTHERYKERCGGEFGKTIKGIFTDEPGLHDTHTAFDPNRGWIPWTYGFHEYFKQKRGYDPLDLVPLVYFDHPDSAAIRHDYWRTVTELFTEAFSKQISDWCGQNGLQFTGHFLQENRIGLACRVSGAIMPHYVYQHVPGIDMLSEQTNEYLTVRQCTSVANQYGKKYVLSETYGCTGWQFTFEGQKWMGDWQFVMGVNRRCHHLALYSIKGCRKRDYPPVFNYNTTWWKYNHVIEGYFARLSAVLTQGKPVRDVLVLHPSATAWACLGTSPYGTPRRRDERDIPEIDKIGGQLNQLMKFLMGCHYDFDLGDELLIEADGFVREKLFGVRDCVYKAVILPPQKSMLTCTYGLLMKFLDNGGRVIALHPTATLLDGRTADLSALYSHANLVHATNNEEVVDALSETIPKHVSIKNEDGGDIADLYCMLRDIEDGLKALFIINNSRRAAHTAAVTLLFPNTHIEEWEPLTGSVSTPIHNNAIIHATFLPTDSKLYVLRNIPPSIYDIPRFAFSRTMPNALTLDTCSYKIKDEPFSEPMQVWQAQREIRKAFGMRQVHKNGATQRYKWIGAPNPHDGTLVALRFCFDVADIPAELSLAAEDVGLFGITLNGVPADTRQGGFYIDKSIGVVRLGGVKTGTNELIVSCAYQNRYELEDIYLIGDFAVDAERRVTVEPTVLNHGDWCLQGYPHYPGGIIYKSTFTLAAYSAVSVRTPVFAASVVEIRVNGHVAAYVPWKYAESIDITGYAQAGENRLEIEVTATPRNLFGPLHFKGGNPFTVNPASFRTEGDGFTPEYNLQPYGLLAPVQIIVCKGL